MGEVTVSAEICPVCKTESAEYDPVTKMFLCRNCGELFEPGEAGCSKKTIRRNKRARREIEEDNEDDSYYDEQDEDEYEDLNLFSCFIIGVALLVPLLNMFIAYIVGNSRVKTEYQKIIMSFLIVTMLIHLGVFYLVAGGIKEIGDSNVFKEINKASEQVATNWAVGRLGELELVRESIRDKNALDSIEPIIPIEEEEEDKTLTHEEFEFIAGSVQSGIITQQLVEKYKEYEISILMKSKDMQQRYEGQYRNFGLLLFGSEKNGNNNYFIDDMVYNSYKLDDYDEVKNVGFDDLSNTKYIFCIKKDRKYQIDLIVDTENNILGLKITEVEVD